MRLTMHTIPPSLRKNLFGILAWYCIHSPKIVSWIESAIKTMNNSNQIWQGGRKYYLECRKYIGPHTRTQPLFYFSFNNSIQMNLKEKAFLISFDSINISFHKD